MVRTYPGAGAGEIGPRRPMSSGQRRRYMLAPPDRRVVGARRPDTLPPPARGVCAARRPSLFEELDMDWKLEVIVIPVSDVDRAKAFYTEQVGYHCDVDQSAGEDFPLDKLD